MTNRIIGANIVPGSPQDQCSLRGNLVGCYTVIRMVNMICKEHGLMEGAIEIGCDNIEASKRAVDLEYIISPDYTHFDLTTGIQAQVKTSPMEI